MDGRNDARPLSEQEVEVLGYAMQSLHLDALQSDTHTHVPPSPAMDPAFGATDWRDRIRLITKNDLLFVSVNVPTTTASNSS